MDSSLADGLPSHAGMSVNVLYRDKHTIYINILYISTKKACTIIKKKNCTTKFTVVHMSTSDYVTKKREKKQTAVEENCHGIVKHLHPSRWMSGYWGIHTGMLKTDIFLTLRWNPCWISLRLSLKRFSTKTRTELKIPEVHASSSMTGVPVVSRWFYI